MSHSFLTRQQNYEDRRTLLGAAFPGHFLFVPVPPPMLNFGSPITTPPTPARPIALLKTPESSDDEVMAGEYGGSPKGAKNLVSAEALSRQFKKPPKLFRLLSSRSLCVA